MERLFTVIVPKQPRNKRNMKYPPLVGAKALNTMRNLHRRGFEIYAETSGFGITEHLTLPEMEEMFAEA